MIAQFKHRAYKQAVNDRLSGISSEARIPDGGRTERIFKRTMFVVMGKLAKLDGLVVDGEIQYATTVMQLLDLNGLARQEAIDYFELGKQRETDVMPFVTELISCIKQRSSLANLFLQVQCRLCFVKGGIRLKEKMLLRDVAEALGFSKAEFLEICNATHLEADFDPQHGRGFLRNAYHTLQLQPDAEDRDIRRAYLRLMSRYHPDKLVQEKNLSEEALKSAAEKLTAIRSAYEAVCGFRKIRA